MVDVASAILVCIVGVLHVLFCVMEIVFWPEFALRLFGYKDHEVMITKALAANQGIYNLGVAVGLFWALFMEYKPTTIMLLCCIVGYAVFGAITVKWSIVLTQGLPALIALIVVAFLMDD